MVISQFREAGHRPEDSLSSALWWLGGRVLFCRAPLEAGCPLSTSAPHQSRSLSLPCITPQGKERGDQSQDIQACFRSLCSTKLVQSAQHRLESCGAGFPKGREEGNERIFSRQWLWVLLCPALPHGFNAHVNLKGFIEGTKLLVLDLGLVFQGTLSLPISAQLQDPVGRSAPSSHRLSLLHTPRALAGLAW